MGATTTQQQSLASLSYNKTHKTILSFPQQLPTNQSIKMQFFAIAATFFAAVMAAPSAKPLMDRLLSSAVSTRSCLAATVTMRHPAPQLAPPTCSSSCQSARLATLMPAPSAARLTTRLVSSTSTSSATTSSRTSASSVPANKRLAFCGFLMSIGSKLHQAQATFSTPVQLSLGRLLAGQLLPGFLFGCASSVVSA